MKYYNLARYFDSYHYKFGMNHCQLFLQPWLQKGDMSEKGLTGLNQHHFQPMLAEGSKVRSDPQTEPGAIWNRFRSTSYVEIDVFCLKIIFLVRLTWGMGTHDFRTFFLRRGGQKNHQLDFLYSPDKA